MKYIDFDAYRRQTIIRFFIYGIFGIIVTIATIVFVLAAEGFDIDRETGQVIQNGLVLVSTEPSGSRIWVNGNQENDLTDSRLALPAGEYEISVWQDEYRDWKRNITVVGSEVSWLNYIILIPSELTTTPVVAYDDLTIYEQSPEHNYLLLADPSDERRLELYNLTRPGTQPERIILRQSLFTLDEETVGELSFVDWSENENAVVLKHELDNEEEYLYVNLQEPELAVNITEEFDISIEQLRFGDDTDTRLTVLIDSDLRYIEMSNLSLSRVLARDVINYSNEDNGSFVLVRNDEVTTSLHFVTELLDDELLLFNKAPRDVVTATFDGNTYTGIVTFDGTIDIYQNLKDINSLEELTDVYATIPSSNPRLIPGEKHSQYFAVIDDESQLYTVDFEDGEIFAKQLEGVEEIQDVRWADDFHIAALIDDTAMIMDFEGSNLYALRRSNRLPIFTPRITDFYSVEPASVSKKPRLVLTSLLPPSLIEKELN